ncbi:MAG: AAA family ATPase [Fimbriimonadaceae bacterium]|nr:AAA family ATPase [Fimbriimonadaceae bacterium]
MRLLELTISGFRALDSIALPLCDDFGAPRPLTVLAGPNGSGKTSILFAIVQTLRGLLRYQTARVPLPDDLDVRRTRADLLAARPDEALCHLTLQFDADEVSAIRELWDLSADQHRDNEQQAIRNVPDLPNGRVQITWGYPPERTPVGVRPSWWARDISPRGAHPWLWGYGLLIRLWTRGRLVEPRRYFQAVGGLRFYGQHRDLASEVQPPDDADDGQITTERSVNSADLSLREVLLSVDRRPVSGGGSAAPDSPTIAELITSKFNQVCAPRRYIGVRYPGGGPVGHPYLEHNDRTYPLHYASAGEQVVLDHLARLSYPSPLGNGIVLMDEPDLHLHPTWLRRWFQLLPEIGGDNQYIVTTQSPVLRELAVRDNILFDLGELG